MLRTAALTVLAAAAACVVSPPPPPSAKPPSGAPPNVVLVFVDDLGWGDLGCTGGPHRTPVMDALAADGAFFTDFSVAQPVCSASRAALLTGCYPNRLGIHGALGPNAKHGLHPDATTLAELLHARGYATALFGKWHLGHLPEFLPTRHGFDEFAGIPYSNDMWPHHPQSSDYPPLPYYEQEEIVARDPDQRDFTLGFARRGADFIHRSAAAGKPFFLYLPQPMPHVPLHVSEAFRGRSANGLYGDVIEELDASVGILTGALEAAGVADNTILIFSSDNGPWLSYGDHAGSAGPYREGKGTVFEGGVRVPLIVRWPRGIPAGTVVREPCMAIDLYPTLRELTRGTAPEAPRAPQLPIDGRNLSPLLIGAVSSLDPEHPYYYWYDTNALQAMRVGRWKLHFPHGYRSMIGRTPGRDGAPGLYDSSVSTELELYDLVQDPGESRDLSAEYWEVVARMTAMADLMSFLLGDSLQGQFGGIESREPGRVP